MWYRPENEASVFTPAVLVFPDRIEENIRRMIDLAGDVQRLRPHVKTHKIAEVISLQVQMGITRFKCATLSEVEMVAANGGLDVLLAYPLLGPAIQNFLQLMEHYPGNKVFGYGRFHGSVPPVAQPGPDHEKGGKSVCRSRQWNAPHRN